MKKTTEGGVEAKMLEYLGDMGWETYGDPEEGIWGGNILDEKYGRETSEVIYWELLKQKIQEFNDVSEREAEKAVNQLRSNLGNENLIDGNKDFHNILRSGKTHTIQTENGTENKVLRLIHIPEKDDKEEFTKELLEKNDFIAANQYTVIRPEEVRTDINLFVNGIPLVNIELKNDAGDTKIKKAIKELKDYEEDSKRLFIPGLLNVACDGEKFRTAAVGSKEKFYFPWRSENYHPDDYEPKDATYDLLNPYTLMDIFQHFVFYDEEAKITPRYMQYRAANKMVDQIKRGEPQKGLVWHTQGSGKSYTMLFTAYKAKKSDFVDDRKFLLIVDRKKLEDQMSTDLENVEFPLFDVAEDMDHLEQLLEDNKKQLILTTIQKFEDVDTDIDPDVNEPPVLLVDEAHRFTEGKLGNRLKNAVPNAMRFGLTGTPVVQGEDDSDNNTFQEFSSKERGYLDRYSIKQGQRDDVITEVTVTDVDFEWKIPEEEIDQDFDQEFEDLPFAIRQQIINKFISNNDISEIEPYINRIIDQIVKHHDEHLRGTGFKGMVVTQSRKLAAIYSDKLKERMGDEEVEAVISIEQGDPDFIQKYERDEEDERELTKKFRKKRNPKILVVCQKLLTGFDAPVLKTLYLDRNLTDHNLLQAMARTNRPMTGKKNGEIVDFRGTFRNPEEALDYEDFNIVENAVKDTDELADEFEELLGEIVEIFDDFTLENDPEELNRCKVMLQRNPEIASKFKGKYEDAEEIYESLMPHKLLGQPEIEEKWEAITQIYHKYRNAEEGKNLDEGSIDKDDVREKTLRILEDNLEITDVSKEKIEFEQPEREVEFEEDPEPGVAKKGPKLREQTSRTDNPAYSSLSEKVKDIIEDWREGKSSEKALKELENVEEELDEIEDEQQELGMTDSEYAIYKLLEERYSDELDGKAPEEVARRIGEKLKSERIGINYLDARDTLRGAVIQALNEENLTEMAVKNNGQFLEEATNYLMQNEYHAPN
jgi:type I restriction enzyme R subunit